MGFQSVVGSSTFPRSINPYRVFISGQLPHHTCCRPDAAIVSIAGESKGCTYYGPLLLSSHCTVSTPSSSTTLHSASTAAPSASSMLSVVPVPVPLGVIGEVIDEYMDMICWRDSVKAEGKKSGNRLGVGFRVGARARVRAKGRATRLGLGLGQDFKGL